MSAMYHEELAQRISVLLDVVCHGQAEHCGYHYITFRATEDVLKKIIRAGKTTYANVHISVHVEGEELQYYMGFAPSHALEFIEALEKEFKVCERCGGSGIDPDSAKLMLAKSEIPCSKCQEPH
jgi:hypothetical protein